MKLSKIEKKIMKNRAVKDIIKVRDFLNKTFSPRDKKLKFNIKDHTVDKNFSKGEKWLIRHI